MIGNFLNKKMMGKMGEMQQQMEEIKAKLAKISAIGEADNGNAKVVANGNRMLDSISISDDAMKNLSKEELEKLIVTASNRALEQAERIEKTEMSHAAMNFLPGMG